GDRRGHRRRRRRRPRQPRGAAPPAGPTPLSHRCAGPVPRRPHRNGRRGAAHRRRRVAPRGHPRRRPGGRRAHGRARPLPVLRAGRGRAAGGGAVTGMLVAGLGNVFLGDDGFGVEVVRRLAAEPQPEGVRVGDFGIRGLHLAYELLDGYDTVVLVDAGSRGGAPGELHLLEVSPDDLPDLATPNELVGAGGVLDAHAMTPDAVLALLATLRGS